MRRTKRKHTGRIREWCVDRWFDYWDDWLDYRDGARRLSIRYTSWKEKTKKKRQWLKINEK